MYIFQRNRSRFMNKIIKKTVAKTPKRPHLKGK